MSISPATGCTYEAAACTFSCANNVRFDLSALKPPQGATDSTGTDGDGPEAHSYFWRTCDEANLKTQCNSKTEMPKSQWAAIQQWSGGQGKTKLGDVEFFGRTEEYFREVSAATSPCIFQRNR